MSSNRVSRSRQVQLGQVVQSTAQLSSESPLGDGDATIYPSNLFQWLTTLTVKILYI